MTIEIAFYPVNKERNIYCYKFPLVQNESRLTGIYVFDGEDTIDLDIDLSQIDWDNLHPDDCVVQYMVNYDQAIVAIY